MQGTTQVCMDCGYESRLNRIDGHYICKKCGSHNVVTREVNNHDETLFNTMESMSNDIEDIMTQMLFAEFEATLDHGTNVWKLYELLTTGVNRDNPHIKNYVKTISTMWGGCSQQNVLQTMYKLQVKLTKFLEGKGFDIHNGRLVDRNVK